MSTATLAKRDLVEPDYWTCPHGIRVRPTATYGPAVAELCDKAGFTPDPQQELGLDLVFAIRPDLSPASFSFCIICARQNLKSGLFLQCVIGWLFVTETPEVVWSAHELKTSLDAQAELFQILESPALSRFLPPTPNAGKYDTNGKERQELSTGQTVWFQTRTRDGGRGLKKPKVIIDEAFKFKARAAGALIPILLAQHHPQLLYGSSAPPLDPDAAVLRDVIERGRGHLSPELSYLEWLAPREPCADPDCTHPKNAVQLELDCALDREHLLRRANPTLTTGRITMQTLRNLRQELPPDEFKRECLGWMDEEGELAGPPRLHLRKWNDLKAPKVAPPQRVTVVVDVEPNGTAATVGVAGPSPAGRTLLLVTHKPGTAWVAGQVKKLKANVDVLEVGLHPTGQAGFLGAQLTALGIDWHPLVHGDRTRGCVGMAAGVDEGRYVHVDQRELNDAVAVARTKTRNGTEDWDRTATSTPIGPVIAAATAAERWAVLTAKPKKKAPPPRRSSGSSSTRVDDISTAGF